MPPIAGQKLGSYLLLEKLGEGGMGVVWKAEDPRLGRQIALKTLHPGTASDPSRQARFEQEARAVAALNHPGIVTLYTIEEAEGIHFLTLELVHGEQLTRRIPSAGLPLAELLDLAIPMTDAVAAAHARGITHRDLKPDNVMVSTEGRVKVLDFGLAKLREEDSFLEGDGSLSPTQTKAGMIFGTLNYMSPEQAQGEPADARSDVFTLGLMLYEMATGRKSFTGQNPISVISSILKDPSPSLVAARPELPTVLEEVVHRCLEKAPEDRYPSAAELRDALEALRELTKSGEILKSGATSAAAAQADVQGTARASGGTTGRTLGIAIGAIVLIAAAVVIFLMMRQTGPATTGTREASVAILPLSSLGGDDAELAAGIHDDLITQVSRIRSLKVISRTSVLGFQGTGLDLSVIAAELDVATVLEGSVRRQGDRVRVNVQLIDPVSSATLWGESYDRELTANDMFAIQSEIAHEIASALSAALSPQEQQALQQAPTEDLDAYTSFLRGQALSREYPSEETLERKIEAYARAVELDPSFVRAWAGLSTAQVQMYWRGFDRRPERLARSKEALDRAEALDPMLPETALARGYHAYWGYRDYGPALAAFEEAARGLPNDVSVLAGQAYIERRMGRWEESVDRLDRALELDPRNQYLLTNQLGSYQVLRRLDEARGIAGRILELYPGDEDAKGTFRNLSLNLLADPGPWLALAPEPGVPLMAFILAGDWPAALAEIDNMDPKVTRDQIRIFSPELLRGEILSLMGQRDQARPYLEEARSWLEDEITNAPRDPRAHAALGTTLALLGEEDLAIRTARRATELLPYETDSMDAGTFVYALAKVYGILGRRAEAIQELDRYLSNPGRVSAAYVARDPWFQDMKDDPEFLALIQRHSSP